MITQSVIIHSNNKNLKRDKVKSVLKLKFNIYFRKKNIEPNIWENIF